MSTNYPTSLDSLANPSSSDYQNVVPHASQHANANDAIEALQVKVGITNSVDANSHEYKVNQMNKLTTKGDILVHDGSNYQRLPRGTDGYMMVADSAQALGVKYITPSSGGTVTTASVVSANGFTGSVANPTSTPAITLTTSITGMLKGNGTAISAATPGTDYVASVTQGNIVTVTSTATITVGMGIYISGGNGTPCDTTTNTRVDGVAIEAVGSGVSFQVDIGSEWKNIPSVTTGNYYTYGNSGVFTAVTSPTSDQHFYCPKNGTLVPSYVKKTFSLISSSCSGIGGSNTSSSVFIDRPTTVLYTISNVYSTVGSAWAYLEASFDNTNWTTLVLESNGGVTLTTTFSGALTFNKVYIRGRTASGNSTSASITIR